MIEINRQIAIISQPEKGRRAGHGASIAILAISTILVAGLVAGCTTYEENARVQAEAAALAASPAPQPIPAPRAKSSSTPETSAPRVAAAPAGPKPQDQGAKIVAPAPEPKIVKASLAADAVPDARVRKLAAEITTELAQRCPLAERANIEAFDACRRAMYGGSKVRAALSEFTLWGRQNKDPSKTLQETNLTQFAPNVLTGMYLPLFMFTGKHAVTYDQAEKLYRVELGARFRNRLPPGQFPYPFWHEDEKWNTYQAANAIILWVDPVTAKIKTAQFSTRGTVDPANVGEKIAMAKFDGKWMWTDADGTVQPKVTLFDGIFRRENPYIVKVDQSYKELAVALREGQCMACHVPNNPYKMKKLVLLQTPAHAAAEIKRVVSTVKRGAMPLDETTGVEEPLKGDTKTNLIKRASEFEKLVEAARAWEAAQPAPTTGQPSRPSISQPPTPRRQASAE
jgi:hypothetical protein